MDIFSLALRFFAAAVVGFFIMSASGIQALVDLCSSIPLARRRKKQSGIPKNKSPNYYFALLQIRGNGVS